MGEQNEIERAYTNHISHLACCRHRWLIDGLRRLGDDPRGFRLDHGLSLCHFGHRLRDEGHVTQRNFTPPRKRGGD